MPSEDRFDDLLERLETDDRFASALELDPFTSLRDAGFEDVADAAAKERDRIGELIDRIYQDEAFRRAVEEHPAEALGEWGLDEAAIGPVLVLAGAPDEVVERATADVEGHLIGRKPATLAAMAAVFGTLAFAQQATAGTQTAQAGMQTNPAAYAQVAPAAQAQVAPAATAQVAPAATKQVAPAATKQVAPAAKAQVAKAAMPSWHGVQVSKLTAQGRLASILRAQGISL
jgi:hypothetical protein